MSGYRHSYRIFNIMFGLLIVVIYCLLQFYIIPDYVHHDKKDMAANYTTYAATALIFVLGVGSTIAEHFDETSSIKSRRH
jgi:hypothetical protein